MAYIFERERFCKKVKLSFERLQAYMSKEKFRKNEFF